MKKISNQIMYNLSKDKSSFISFGIIIVITAMLLNCASVLLRQSDNAYNKKFKKLNTASLNIIVPKAQSDISINAANDKALEKAIKETENVENVETHNAIMTEATVNNFNNADFSMNTVFYNIDDARTLNNFEIVNKAENKVDNPIYIPLYVSEFGGFALNDNIVYVINGISHSFTVAGIIEEMQYGNYSSGLICAYLPENEFDELSASINDKTVVEYSMNINNNANPDKIKSDTGKIIENNGIMALSILDSKSVKSSRTMVTDLLVLILAVFALIILAVSVFLSDFKVKNAIESEITNMSVLKALGYTATQIIMSITIPYAVISLISSVLGVFLSYALIPVVCKALTIQSGLSFSINFAPSALMCIICILCSAVTFFTYVSARKIRIIQPIDGLRGNMTSKHAKTNHFPLEDTRGNIKLLLILKEMAASKKQNIMLFFVSFMLTVLIAFSGTLFYNAVIKPENFMSALSDETPDVIIYPETDSINELETKLGDDKRVEHSLEYISGTVRIEDKTVHSFACEDFSKVRNNLCYIGENPRKSNEIALGSIFEKSFNIGDTVSVTVDNITKDFKVTGFVQSVNSQGEICELDISGYNSLFAQKQTPCIYVYLHNAENAAKITKEYKSGYPVPVSDTVDSHKLQNEAQDMYMSITTIIVIAISAVTILIVLFILYIVIRSLLVKRKQELGIYKAIGYTSPQLILQTAGSFIPTVMTSVLLSSILALFYMPAIYQFLFESMGVMKNNIEISFSFLLLFAAAQILVYIIISIVLCMPIKKISAYKLIKE